MFMSGNKHSVLDFHSKSCELISPLCVATIVISFESIHVGPYVATCLFIKVVLFMSPEFIMLKTQTIDLLYSNSIICILIKSHA